MSMSLHGVGQRRAEPATSARCDRRDARAGRRRAARPTSSATGSSDARARRPLGVRARAPRGRSPRPWARSPSGPRIRCPRPPRRAARRASRCRAPRSRRRARLGPRPGEPRHLDHAGGELRPQLLRGGDRRRSPAARRSSPRASRRRPGARSPGPRAPSRATELGRLADRLRRVAVGDDAVDDRAVELVEVAELVERGREVAVRGVRHRCALPYAALMRGPAWLVLPTYNEAENLERIVAAARAVLADAAPEGFRILVVDDDSPDGTGAIADRLAAEHPARSRCCTARSREGLGPAYLAGFRHALDGGAGAGDGDGQRLLARPGRPRAPAARRCATGRADLALGSRYTPGGARRRLGPAPAARQPRRLPLRPARADAAGARPDRRLQVLPRRGARGDRPAVGALARLRLPGRADLPRAAPRASASSRCRSSSATASSASRRCPGGSPPRRSGSCRRCACARLLTRPDARGPHVPAPCGRREGGWTPIVSSCSRGCATRARRSSAGPRTPARSSCRGSSARSRSRSTLLTSVWVIASLRPGRTSRRRCSPGSTRRPTWATRRPHPVPQLARPARCTRWRASRASSPARRCRCRSSTRRASRASCTRRPGPFAIAFVSAATLFSLVTQAWVLGQHRLRPRAAARHLPAHADPHAAAARDPRARRAVPAARRLAHRQPPRRVGGAAGGDVRDGRDRHPAASSAPRSSRSTCGRTSCAPSRRSTDDAAGV